MFKILHEIASNLHSPAACKMYTKLQKSPPGLLLQSEGPKTDEFLLDSGVFTLVFPSPKATPRFIISYITVNLFL